MLFFVVGEAGAADARLALSIISCCLASYRNNMQRVLLLCFVYRNNIYAYGYIVMLCVIVMLYYTVYISVYCYALYYRYALYVVIRCLRIGREGELALSVGGSSLRPIFKLRISKSEV